MQITLHVLRAQLKTNLSRRSSPGWTPLGARYL